jgi:hypothetical protein
MFRKLVIAAIAAAAFTMAPAPADARIVKNGEQLNVFDDNVVKTHLKKGDRIRIGGLGVRKRGLRKSRGR